MNSSYFKTHTFDNDIVDLHITEIDMLALRSKEEMISEYLDPRKDPDLTLVTYILFDDYCSTPENPNITKCFYIDCIKTKPFASKGSGSCPCSKLSKI